MVDPNTALFDALVREGTGTTDMFGDVLVGTDLRGVAIHSFEEDSLTMLMKGLTRSLRITDYPGSSWCYSALDQIHCGNVGVWLEASDRDSFDRFASDFGALFTCRAFSKTSRASHL